ncbi:sodium:solute symporter [Bacillus sp. FJAT-29790]|uniref:sodium:solute symporter family transporter n=1 Tax=Bacillus sp. FJAT-29790 TaxID=1895002 RepID=UPI001C23600D|nr:sodium:solute symporter [Bacillus sp. FJAT-29790]MBU8878583.1 sodium:solute symporter [Bacillus sp. FJAT-29790]
MITNLDYIVILIYIGILVGIGIFSVRKIEDENDFLVAGRRLSYNLYVPALAAVVLGGGSTFGSVALGYQYGISGMWLVFMFGFGIFVIGIFFSKKLSKLKVFSVSEMLGEKYGQSSRLISGWIMIVYDFMITVTANIGMGLMFSAIFDIKLSTAIIIGGLIMLAYTILGGMWAVTLTDVIQFWVLAVGFILILMPLGIYNVGGISGMASKLDPSFFNIANIGGKSIFAFFLMFTFGIIIGQDIWQRVFTAKDEKIMRKGTIIAGVFCVIYGIAGAIIGMVASIVLPRLNDPQTALSELIMTILPTGIVGLVIAAVISALMSTASGTIMATSTIVVNDFLLQTFKKDFSEKQKVKLTRIVILVVSLLAIGASIYLENLIVALDVAYALLSGSIFLPVIAALFWKRITSKTALISMLISSIVIIVDLSIEGASSLNAIIFGVAAGGIIMLIGAFKTKPIEIPAEKSSTI